MVPFLSWALLALATLCLSNVTPTCGPTFSPYKCVSTFTPPMPPQCGPTSTVYKTILTTEYNIVDCRYCTVTNVDANARPQGPFTTKVTSSILTVTRVRCVTPAAAITRRDVQIESQFQEIKPRAVAAHQPVIRSSSSQHLHRSIQDLAEKVSHNIDPNNPELTVEAYTFLVQLNSAIFALNLINSGFNLTWVCQECRKPAIQLQLLSASLAPKQVGDIVCFASIYGVDFNTTSAQLLNDLEAAVYGIQVGSNFTTNTNRLCDVLNLRNGPYLGIDSNGITRYICSANNFTTTTSSPTFTAPTVEPSAGTETLTTVGSQASAGTIGTGNAGPYANSTIPVGTVASHSLTIDYSNNTVLTGHVPPSPTARLFYETSTSSTTSVIAFKRY